MMTVQKQPPREEEKFDLDGWMFSTLSEISPTTNPYDDDFLLPRVRFAELWEVTPVEQRIEFYNQTRFGVERPADEVRRVAERPDNQPFVGLPVKFGGREKDIAYWMTPKERM